MAKRYRKWSKDEHRQLRSMAGSSKAKAIARKLKRTEGAVRQYAASKGVSLSVQG